MRNIIDNYFVGKLFVALHYFAVLFENVRQHLVDYFLLSAASRRMCVSEL